MTGLTAFDLDGTLVHLDSSWRWVHNYLGTLEAAKTNADLYFTGKIDYVRWAELDVALWSGTLLSHLQEAVTQNIYFIPGAQELVETLRKWKVKTAIVSSGLTLFADFAREALKIDVSYANQLLTDEEGRICGVDTTVGFTNKDKILNQVAEEMNIPLEQCVAIGDARNDIPMFKIAGASIAFNPSHDEVASNATTVIRSQNLLDVLPFLRTFFQIED